MTWESFDSKAHFIVDINKWIVVNLFISQKAFLSKETLAFEKEVLFLHVLWPSFTRINWGYSNSLLDLCGSGAIIKN